MLKQLQQAGLRLNKEKSEFLATSVVYLGHKIDAKGLHPTADKVDAISRAPTPKNCTELKEYLDLPNYCNKFIPNLATELHSLCINFCTKVLCSSRVNKKIENFRFSSSYYSYLNC